MTLLEACRGIAALLIVAFHTTGLFRLKFGEPFLGSIFAFGDAGVDFFFVLSGFFFAISSIKYAGEKSQMTIFFYKKLVRIYPFYLLVTAAVIPMYILFPQFGSGHERGVKVILKSLLLLPQDNFPILSVAWFLSHIVLFYFVFGWAIFFRSRLASILVGSWLALSAMVMAVDLCLGFDFLHRLNFLVGFFFSYHNLEFALGGLVAIAIQSAVRKRFSALPTFIVGCLGFAAFGMVEVYFLNLSSPALHYYEFFAYGLTSAVIVLGAALVDIQHHLKPNRYFSSLGKASYAIYLTHYLLLSIFTKLILSLGNLGIGIRTSAMVLSGLATVLIGIAIHKVI
ncbi:MAG: acyltransferase, partial [Cyanobacteria bacterium P01_A01_bin.135]